jgi:hypothetical protein
VLLPSPICRVSTALCSPFLWLWSHCNASPHESFLRRTERSALCSGVMLAVSRLTTNCSACPVAEANLRALAGPVKHVATERLPRRPARSAVTRAKQARRATATTQGARNATQVKRQTCGATTAQSVAVVHSVRLASHARSVRRRSGLSSMMRLVVELAARNVTLAKSRTRIAQTACHVPALPTPASGLSAPRVRIQVSSTLSVRRARRAHLDAVRMLLALVATHARVISTPSSAFANNAWAITLSQPIRSIALHPLPVLPAQNAQWTSAINRAIAHRAALGM